MRKTRGLLIFAFSVLSACAPTDSATSQSGFSESGSGIVGGHTARAWDTGAKATVLIYEDGDVLCSGTLIGPRLVVTAAHCLEDVFPRTDLSVGFPLFSEEDADIADYRQNKAYRDHTEVKSGIKIVRTTGDIALLVLKTDAPKGAVFASLPEEPIAIGSQQLFALGGGDTGANQGHSGTLRAVKLIGKIKRGTEDEILFDQTKGRGVCHGDSGGPILQIRKRKLVLVGVVSGATDYKVDGDQKAVGDICRYSGLAIQTGSNLKWLRESIGELRKLSPGSKL